MKLLIFLLISTVTVINAQHFNYGSCPNVTRTHNIDINRMLGRWYEVRRYYTFFDNMKCVKHVLYNLFNIAQFVISKTTDEQTGRESWNYGVEYQFGSGTGNMISVYPGARHLTRNIPVPILYNIVDTDYDNYAIAYYCIDLYVMHVKFAWILTRTASPSQATMDRAFARFDSYGLERKPLYDVSHNGCAWFH